VPSVEDLHQALIAVTAAHQGHAEAIEAAGEVVQQAIERERVAAAQRLADEEKAAADAGAPGSADA
jgi:hypothetical protein